MLQANGVSCWVVLFGSAWVTPIAQAADDDGSAPQEVIVTGTRQLSRTVAESLAPIDVLSFQVLTRSGKQSTRDLLATLVPSISMSNSGSGASFAVKTVSLRGLSGDQALVLINGKRRHNTAVLFINGTTQNGQSPPDLDLIPISSIERVEVLRDGASAQYGSDAIAGVINIILNSSDHTSAATGIVGETGEGDGETSQLYADRGFSFGDGGQLHVSVDGRIQQRTDRGALNTSVLYPLIDGQPDPREATADRHTNHPGQPHVKMAETAYDLSLPLSDAVTFYSFATGAARASDSWLSYRNPNASNNNLAVYPDGYVPRLLVRDKDYQAAAGVRGKGLFGVNWDFSSTFGRDQVKYTEFSALNASLGPESPTTFYIGSLTLKEWTNNLDLSRDIETQFFSAPLFSAAGLEFRRNEYSIGAGDPASYIDGGYRATSGPLAGVRTVPGSQGVTGFPADAAGAWSRHNTSAYLNFEQKLTSTFEVGLAGRHERYSDFGNTTTGKLSMRFEPIDGYALRGTVSTGFRAPTLAQEHYASSSTIQVRLDNSTSTVLYPVRTLPVDSPAAIALGAKPLQAEQSTNYSLGVVLQPLNRLNVTLDVYRIDIDDRILLTGTLVGSAVSAALASAGLSPDQGGFYFTNAADTSTRGVDLVTTFRSDFDKLGTVDWSFSANYNKTEFDRIAAPPAELAAAGLVLIDRARQGDFTKGTPRHKFIVSAAWSFQRLDADLRFTRYGEVTQVSPTSPIYDDTISPKLLVDLDVGYDLSNRARFSIGANNLFNIYPDVLMATNQGATGFSYYNSYSPFGISGGFYYSRFTYQF